jgi:hypothetical protein
LGGRRADRRAALARRDHRPVHVRPPPARRRRGRYPARQSTSSSATSGRPHRAISRRETSTSSSASPRSGRPSSSSCGSRERSARGSDETATVRGRPAAPRPSLPAGPRGCPLERHAVPVRRRLAVVCASAAANHGVRAGTVFVGVGRPRARICLARPERAVEAIP